ncbi:DUF2231 domain-containing protein [Hyphobacterium sp.]|uniref:DUF2231 domain-containing protein n=1 Tax=Hyphobacterium sp. TaxID=2004662 RepID=UPI003BAAEA46
MTATRLLSGLALALILFLVPVSVLAHPPAEHRETENAVGESSEAQSEPESRNAHHPASPDDDRQDHPSAHEVQNGQAAADVAGGHAHWGDHGPQTDLERAIAKAGALHSVAVHFPIALVLVAALAHAIGLTTGRPGYAETVRFLVWTAAFGGFAAGVLGWAHAGPAASTETGIMSIHRWLGSGLAVGLFALAGSVEWHRRTQNAVAFWTMNLILFLAVLAVLTNAFLGGSLAHGGLAHLMGG